MLNVLRCSHRYFPQCRTILSNRLQNSHIKIVANFHRSAYLRSKDDSEDRNKDSPEIAPNIATKYDLFTDDKATIVLDMEEERERILAGELDVEEIDDSSDIFEGLNTEHGKTGVFDIEDLVAVLKRDNAQEIFVCKVPKELKYVDYMVVITARSYRHMKAISEFVRKMYKLKRHNKEQIPKIEGKNSDEWMALDLGNIALHIFSAQFRKQFDLEMLWSVGPQYDTETNKPTDPIFELYDQHSFLVENQSKINEVYSGEDDVKLDGEMHPSKLSDEKHFSDLEKK